MNKKDGAAAAVLFEKKYTAAEYKQ